MCGEYQGRDITLTPRRLGTRTRVAIRTARYSTVPQNRRLYFLLAEAEQREFMDSLQSPTVECQPEEVPRYH